MIDFRSFVLLSVFGIGLGLGMQIQDLMHPWIFICLPFSVVCIIAIIASGEIP